ncbi:uncharacterized protein BX664DRAFT_298315 [Halteromyces radiatus]|uniref:uncharacterized protein n=1 Tax=Halteromyces radiatus TaxID=101107 RepID=UPI00221F3609|nr:uncharacterized protein BX664DRAFT_298315 [Halteromyces radiatus]KAI8086012.1 hypothetical protein BX664DRAFT_298315 [Halteromyces radiatus]
MNEDKPSIDLAPPLPEGSTILPTLPIPSNGPTRFTTIPPIDETKTLVDNNNTVYDPLSRAGLSTKPRLLVMTSVGAFWGFGIGAFIGGRQSGLQYLAENAHRLPTTVQGWYFYHKTKNYRVMLGGIKRGMRYAVKTGGLCLLYGMVEAGLDDIRGEADIVNSVTAGVTTGAMFSTITKLSRGSFRYSMVFGALFGLATGGLSDLHKTASGTPPSYIQWLSDKWKKT